MTRSVRRARNSHFETTCLTSTFARTHGISCFWVGTIVHTSKPTCACGTRRVEAAKSFGWYAQKNLRFQNRVNPVLVLFCLSLIFKRVKSLYLYGASFVEIFLHKDESWPKDGSSNNTTRPTRLMLDYSEWALEVRSRGPCLSTEYSRLRVDVRARVKLFLATALMHAHSKRQAEPASQVFYCGIKTIFCEQIKVLILYYLSRS